MHKQKGFFEYLGFAGLVSMLALAAGWMAIIFLFQNLPYVAIIFEVLAFYFDTLDGYVARKTRTVSEFGKLLDSTLDFFNYSVFSALLFWKFLLPNSIGILVGYIILSTGAFRLSRFNVEGFVIKNKQYYYSGIVVCHISLTVIILFFLKQIYPAIITFISTPIVIIISVMQISRIMTKKTSTYSFWLTIAFVILITSLFFQLWHKY